MGSFGTGASAHSLASRLRSDPLAVSDVMVWSISCGTTSLMTSTRSSCFMAAGRNMVSGPLLAKTRDLQTGPYDSEVSSDTGAEGALVISHPRIRHGFGLWLGHGWFTRWRLRQASGTNARAFQDLMAFLHQMLSTSLITSCSCGGYDCKIKSTYCELRKVPPSIMFLMPSNSVP